VVAAIVIAIEGVEVEVVQVAAPAAVPVLVLEATVVVTRAAAVVVAEEDRTASAETDNIKRRAAAMRPFLILNLAS
jgi:hypothetical protein